MLGVSGSVLWTCISFHNFLENLNSALIYSNYYSFHKDKYATFSAFRILSLLPALSLPPSIYQLSDKSGTCTQYLTLWKEWYPKNRSVRWKWIAGSHFTYKHTANVTDWSQNKKSATTHYMNWPTSHVTFRTFPDTVSFSTMHLTHTQQGKSILNSYHPFDLI
jgi:hypothetical protein